MLCSATSGPRWRRLAAAALAVGGGLAAVLALGLQPAHARQARPNVVVIYTDDQELASFTRRYMPQTKRLLARRGTELTQFVVSTPLCCPSRVSYLTGQYPHNNGVFSNKRGYERLRHRRSTLAGWLRDAGYQTAWVGRFLHGYDRVADVTEPAPGWQRWYATLTPRYYDYKLGVNGREVHYASAPRDYKTSVLARKAVRVIERYAPRRRPLFMTVDFPAPHSGAGDDGRCAGAAVPAPRDRRRFAEEPLPTPPSFNELDVSDKPQRVREKPPVGPKARLALERHYGCRLAALRAVDRGMRGIYEAIERAGEARNTAFLFTSDNGYLLGEHRLEGKGVAYEEAIRVPLVVRAPKRILGAAQVRESSALAANVDLAPTILDLAGGVRPCRSRGRDCRALDGRSLVPLLTGSETWSEREVLLEAGKGGEPCLFRGLRSASEVYIEHAPTLAPTGGCAPPQEIEYYDLVADPFQLENEAASGRGLNPARRAQLAAQLARLESCAGASCR